MTEKVTALQYFEKYIANQVTECQFRQKFGIPIWFRFNEVYYREAKVALDSNTDINTSYIERTLNGLTVIPRDQIPKIIEYCHDTYQLFLIKQSLGPTFKLNPSSINLPFTYVSNWDYIQSLKDKTVKETLFNFINSLLYRGEKLWMFDEESALSLVAYRNCSDEAQDILDKGMR